MENGNLRQKALEANAKYDRIIKYTERRKNKETDATCTVIEARIVNAIISARRMKYMNEIQNTTAFASARATRLPRTRIERVTKRARWHVALVAAERREIARHLQRALLRKQATIYHWHSHRHPRCFRCDSHHWDAMAAATA